MSILRRRGRVYHINRYYATNCRTFLALGAQDPRELSSEVIQWVMVTFVRSNKGYFLTGQGQLQQIWKQRTFNTSSRRLLKVISQGFTSKWKVNTLLSDTCYFSTTISCSLAMKTSLSLNLTTSAKAYLS